MEHKMQKTLSLAHPRANTTNLTYTTVRNISTPEDAGNEIKVYVGQSPIQSIVELPTNENVRDYLLEAEGKKRKVPTQVHRAIKDTLQNNPDNFSVLNSGIVIVARSCKMDEKNKQLILERPSIINGSQTQGVIKDFISENPEDLFKKYKAHVKFEIIVTNSDELIAETSIARNLQNDVMTISIAGRLGQLTELEESLKKKSPDAKLQMSETKLSDDYIKTEKLLQIIAALVPEELWLKPGDMNKVYSYSMKTKCLKDFQEIYKKAKDTDDKKHSEYKNLYQFYLDIAHEALALYEKWKQHQGFQGTKIQKIERDNGKIVDVPDGIIFPIIASMSAFAKYKDGEWSISPPELFDDAEIIKAAKSVYMDIAHSNPWNMGKSKACYSALYQITSIYKKLGASSEDDSSTLTNQ